MKFNFWADWPASIQVIFLFLGALFIGAIALVIYYDISGPGIVFPWEIVGTRSAIPWQGFIVHSGPFEFPANIDIYAMNELYRGGEMRINYLATYFFLFATTMSLVIGITISTFLGRILYVILTGIFIVVLIFFKFESVLLFGWSDNTTLILIVVTYIGLSE